jgi:hypothetical protein
MIKQKKILLFAIIVGGMGVLIGSITIYFTLNSLLNP